MQNFMIVLNLDPQDCVTPAAEPEDIGAASCRFHTAEHG
jgi:hypothetical protein